MARFPGLPGWVGTRKVKPIWILLKHETVNGSGISWAICRSAPCSRQITRQTTTLLPHHSVFYWVIVHTHTHPFNGPFSGTTQVSRYQKGKTNLDFTEARDGEWQWHQHMQVCTLLHTDNHTSTPTTVFFTGRMPFLPPNQQRQTTEGTITE